MLHEFVTFPALTSLSASSWFIDCHQKTSGILGEMATGHTGGWCQWVSYKFHMLFTTGVDFRHMVFDYCSCRTLTKFASCGLCAREAVKQYLQFKLEHMLSIYIERAVYSESLASFYDDLSSVNGAIVGSVALKMIVPVRDNVWIPRDLNIVVPLGRLCAMSSFFMKRGYELVDTGVDDQYPISDVASFSLYSNGASNVSVSESVHKDSFLSVVFASLHTGSMNFVTANDICCLYPSLTPNHKSCAFWGAEGMNDAAKALVRDRGFVLYTSPSDLKEPCGDLCPVLSRQFRGLRRIGLVCWRGIGVSALGDFHSYAWTIGAVCDKEGCPWQEQVPFDVIHAILLVLTLKSDWESIRSLSRTCKALVEPCQRQLFDTIAIHRTTISQLDSILARSPRLATYVLYLHYYTDGEVEARIYVLLLQQFSQLRSLHITGDGTEKGSVWNFMHEGLRTQLIRLLSSERLECLALTHLRSWPLSLFANCCNLRQLQIGALGLDDTNVTPFALSPFSPVCRLERLSIGSSSFYVLDQLLTATWSNGNPVIDLSTLTMVHDHSFHAPIEKLLDVCGKGIEVFYFALQAASGNPVKVDHVVPWLKPAIFPALRSFIAFQEYGVDTESHPLLWFVIDYQLPVDHGKQRAWPETPLFPLPFNDGNYRPALFANSRIRNKPSTRSFVWSSLNIEECCYRFLPLPSAHSSAGKSYTCLLPMCIDSPMASLDEILDLQLACIHYDSHHRLTVRRSCQDEDETLPQVIVSPEQGKEKSSPMSTPAPQDQHLRTGHASKPLANEAFKLKFKLDVVWLTRVVQVARPYQEPLPHHFAHFLFTPDYRKTSAASELHSFELSLLFLILPRIVHDCCAKERRHAQSMASTTLFLVNPSQVLLLFYETGTLPNFHNIVQVVVPFRNLLRLQEHHLCLPPINSHRELSTTVLKLADLWEDVRSVRKFLGEVAPKKEALENQTVGIAVVRYRVF
ncbi:uncharacterized protein LACBIDRAFT_332367 [Laccaria bicolor S238N-H82]|uniref:Predicted protein n=1 Tax=Laccaria bicolor (strain S238N-H82 / ATCC MYA-4686) TaxID=486041 RepID=B0DSI2_LACBS|nr:uncharacterized protein LACBIDRAFT_332367 [Laccaria bicolor S238N-H82]EDR02552.1 predicted protein [Laccaria bicolor S238N-H82]|eukprot:XP_001886915.1 predicted protein [Laccaria bicolor S238N-H82]